MEDFLRPLKLSKSTRTVLDRLDGPRALPTALYGQEQKLAEGAMRRIVDPLLEAAGLRPNRLDQYHWFLRELAKLFRTRYGHELAFSIELAMRKWAGYELSAQVMGFLVSTVDTELRKLMGETGKDDGDGHGEEEAGTDTA